MGETQER